MPKGKSKRGNAHTSENLVLHFMAIPTIVLISIYVAGTLVESLFGLPGAIKYIFLGIGGTGFVVVYFNREIKAHFQIDMASGANKLYQTLKNSKKS
ncbi:MAG: hypothetical protein Q7T26_04175 [Dehalococcoidia bacterium]|nr:hypothetical protein [Dehalococcoidia bacterium]